MSGELQTRNTVVAIKEETTQNTLVAPSAATDFIPVLDGFSLTPAFDTIESTEFSGTIGKTKSIKSSENPTASIPIYWKGSGVEGQAPNWGLLLKSLIGSVVVASTEYDTIAGSTATVLNVNAGEEANFQRGQAVLVKDSTLTNGYQIRNIASTGSGTLTLAQALPASVAAGINLGKAVLYKPVNTGHPPFSLYDYRANGGLIQVSGGSRAVSLSATVDANDAIEATFEVEGVEYYYNPMTVTASNKFFDFDEGGTEINVSISEKVYKDPYELAQALQDALNNSTATGTYVVAYNDSTSKFTITVTGVATFNILWKTGVHGSDNTDTHIGNLIGYVDSANDTGALSYVADNAWSNLQAPYTPDYDDSDINVAKDNQVLIGSSTDISCFRATNLTINVGHEHFKIPDICATSGRGGSIFTSRDTSIDVSFYLTQGQTEEFKRFRANDEIIFTYNFGKKSGGNWLPGYSWNVHIPTAVISDISIGDGDGLVLCEMTLTGFVKDGQPEIYINQL